MALRDAWVFVFGSKGASDGSIPTAPSSPLPNASSSTHDRDQNDARAGAAARPSEQHDQRGGLTEAQPQNPHPSAEEHRSAEQKQWKRQLILSWVTFVFSAVATAGAILAYRASERQLQVMRDEQRPWISFDTGIESPLVFTNDEGRIEFISQFRNVGHYPAAHVILREELHFSASARDDINALHTLCDPLRDLPARSDTIGYVVFPGDTKRTGNSLPISTRDIKAGIENDIRKIGPVAKYEGTSLVLLQCVDYTFGTDGTHHQTGKMYNLYWRDPGHGGGTTAFDPIPGRIYPVDQLSLQETLGLGSYVD